MIITKALKINCYFYKLLFFLFPIKVTSETPNSFNSLKLRQSWTRSLAVLISIIIYDIFHIITNLNRIQVAEELLEFILNTFSQYSGVCTLTFVIFLRVIKRKMIIKFLKLLIDFDGQFYEVTQHQINNINWIRNFFMCILAGISIIGGTEYSNCLMYVNDGPTIESFHLCLIMCYIPIIVIFIAELQYSSYMFLVKMRYEAIRDQILDLGEDNMNRNNMNVVTKTKENCISDTMKLQKLMVLYENLNFAMRLINSTFSMQNLVVLVFQFVTLVLLAYNFFIDLSRFVLKF